MYTWLSVQNQVVLDFGHTKKDVIEKGMREWTAKQIRFKPLALWKYPLTHTGGDGYDVDWGYKNDQGEYVDNGVQVV